MHRLLLFITVIATVIVAAVSGSANGKDCVSLFGNVSAEKPAIESMFADRPGWPDSLTEASGTYIRPLRDIGLQDMAGQSSSFALSDYLVRGQGGGEGGAGAAAATDPSAILIQFQIQNVFTPSTYDASGYSNSLILQPVLPFPIAMPGLKHVFPDHIIRPTLPVIAPTADPDGPAGVQGGLGDLTLLDVFVHPVEGFGTVLLGYNAILPTSTHRQLGLGEWQLGPAGAVLYKQIPKTLLGVFVTTQFSFQSDAQQVNVSPIIIRHLPDEWYVGWGDLFWTFDTNTGDYNMPLQARIGKVCKIGHQPVNIFVEPFYTPEGLRRGPASEWGVKLNVTLLFPDKKFKAPLGFLWGGHGTCSRCRR